MTSIRSSVPGIFLLWAASAGPLSCAQNPSNSISDSAGAGVRSIDCAQTGGTKIFPLAGDAIDRRSQAEAALCQNEKDRRDTATAILSADHPSFDYVFIGGAFAAQNVLANASPEVRSHSVVLSSGTSGIIAGSENPGQDWELIFTGHGPAASDPTLSQRWQAPQAFKELFPTKPDNTTNLALQYTLAVNEFGLGVPVIPCRASGLKAEGSGATVDCVLDNGAGRISITANVMVVGTNGFGRPKSLNAEQLSEQNAIDLALTDDRGLPRLMSDWDIFEKLRQTAEPRADFSGRSIFVIGGGNAAASAITDLLDPEITALNKRPAKIFLLARKDQINGPDFAPAVYTRARHAAQCAISPNDCQGDYRSLELLNFGASAAKSVIAIKDLATGAIRHAKITYSQGTEPEGSTTADYILTAIGNASGVEEILGSGQTLEPTFTTEFKRMHGFSGSYEVDAAGGSDPAKLDARGLAIGVKALGLPFTMTGAAMSNSTSLRNLYRDDDAKALKAVLGRYESALKTDYENSGKKGGRTNVNQGALLYNGWITAEFGSRLESGSSLSSGGSLVGFYRPERTGTD